MRYRRKRGKMGYENFYPGGDNPLTYGADTLYTGAIVPAGVIGGTTSVQTANQLTEVSNMLNSGMKTVEVSAINAEVLDMIPRQHLTEINRISKLTGSNTTLHAPVIDPAGFTQQGWNEQERQLVEKQFAGMMDRAHQMSPEGNIPVTIHSSQIPGTEHMPIDQIPGLTQAQKTQLQGKYGDLIPTKVVAVDQDSGQFIPIRMEEKFYPGEKPMVRTPEEELRTANRSYWDNKLSNLIFYKERGDELMSKGFPIIAEEVAKLQAGKITEEEYLKTISSNAEQQAAHNNVQNARVYLDNTQQVLNGLYNQAYKYADPEIRKKLDEASKKYRENLDKPGIDFLKYSKEMQSIVNEMHKITTGKHAPEIYKPVEEFAIEKASQTLSGAALEGYKKFGKTAPIISIENPPYGTAISTGEDLKKLVEATRTQFIKRAKEEGISEGEASRAADQLIGATWDTSHISMIRKQGFGKEQLIKEAEIIAPYVKHVHMNDNFGFTHTDLPPGMGDVPFKEIMEKIEKENPDAKKIFEGGNFFQHFKTSPHPLVLQAMSSPVYEMAAGPSWTQIYGTTGSYSSGYGPFLPDMNFQTYGSGLSGLPMELGGQMPGKQSRVSGAPMA